MVTIIQRFYSLLLAHRSVGRQRRVSVRLFCPEYAQNSKESKGLQGMSERFYMFWSDPSQFGVEALVDVGTQIEQSINNPNGRAKEYYDAAVAAGGTGEFVMNNVAFGQDLSTVTTTAGQGIGRFTGDVTGTITVAQDGSYTVEGSMSFDYGPYNWTPERSSWVGNQLIKYGGNRFNVLGPGRAQDQRGRPLPGAVRYRDGTTFTPVPNRTYNFTAFGN